MIAWWVSSYHWVKVHGLEASFGRRGKIIRIWAFWSCRSEDEERPQRIYRFRRYQMDGTCILCTFTHSLDTTASWTLNQMLQMGSSPADWIHLHLGDYARPSSLAATSLSCQMATYCRFWLLPPLPDLDEMAYQLMGPGISNEVLCRGNKAIVMGKRLVWVQQR